MNKKGNWMILPIILSLALVLFPERAEAAISVSARNAILIEQKSGRILYEKAAHEKRKIASITKIMTAILAIESDKIDETVTVSDNAEGTEGSSLYLKKNEKIKLKDLVYGLMLRSGNDAAVAIAEHVGGSVEGFVFLMNQKAAEIGMSNTHFANPHGLDDSNNHYSTAYDMAILTKYAMENETYQEISGTEVRRVSNPNEKWDRVWRNKNRLLTELYEYCTGGKTGYTKLAKRTLVTTATKGDMNLIAVTLNGPDDWNDHINMYETSFKNYMMAEIIAPGKIKSVDHEFYKGKIQLAHGYHYPIKEKEKDEFRIEMKLAKPKKGWEDNRNVPEVVGSALIYFDGKLIKGLPIYFKTDGEQWLSFFEQFKGLFTSIIGVRENG